MKIFKLLFIALLVTVGFISCQKELNFDDNGTSTGTLKKDGSGNCAPVTVNGIYKVDSLLNASNYVDVQVNVSNPGTFDIKSDTVNGFSFRKAGSVVFGLNTIRLYAAGKPIIDGTSHFTITYGSSTCTFDITVIPPGSSAAVYTIGGAPGNCVGAIAGGTYVANVALAPSNTLTIQVDVSQTGYYAIATIPVNGITFAGTGVFTGTGLQNVVLTGTGTPVNAGVTTLSVTNLTATCTYAITVQTGGGGGGGGSTGSGYYLEFTDGTTTIAADPTGIQALIVPNGGYNLLSVQGFSITGDSAFTVSVAAVGLPVINTNYNTSNLAAPLGVFNGISTLNGQIYEADVITATLNGVNTVIRFDSIDVTNKIVKGTFSGTAQGLTSTRTITNGKFRAPL